MTELDTEAIRQRHRQAAGTRAYRPMRASADDVPALIEEVERLRAALLEEKTFHDMTFDNFEASSEAWLEERTRLLDRLARAEQDIEHLRAAKAAQVKHLTDQIEAARADQ